MSLLLRQLVVSTIILLLTATIGNAIGSGDLDETLKDLQRHPHLDDETAFEFTSETFIELDQDLEYESELHKHLDRMSMEEAEGAADFTCALGNPSNPIPSSVHRLKPSDIKVVGALGDSLTAANGAGATSLAGVILNYRGISWSIGGDDKLGDVVTMPNILRKFSPDVRGYSKGVCFQWQAAAGFNVAKAGAIAQDMPGQADLIIEKMRSSNTIDYHNDWKVVTLFVGGNNLCRYCLNREKHKSENYIKSIRDALDTLHRQLPKTFVNLVTTVDVTLVQSLSVGAICSGLHAVACPCGAYETFVDQEEMATATAAYRQGLHDLVASGRYDTREDFTVVVQPFMENIDIPLDQNGAGDLSFFAPDCFHFSSKAHASGGVGLWNAMIEPVGDKTTHMIPGQDVIKCPSQDKPYLYTRFNSIGQRELVSKAETMRHSVNSQINKEGEVQRNSNYLVRDAVSDEEPQETTATSNVLVYIMLAVAATCTVCLMLVIFISKKYKVQQKDIEGVKIAAVESEEKY